METNKQTDKTSGRDISKRAAGSAKKQEISALHRAEIEAHHFITNIIRKEKEKLEKGPRIMAVIKEYAILTIATLIIVAGVYFFKFPNNFSFGGVTGIAVVLSKVFQLSAASYTTIINIGLLVLGFIFLGKGFGIKTIYVTLLTSGGLEFLSWRFPMTGPLTNEPVLELIYAIFLPALGAAILFNVGASGGGTDILAMILKKYSSLDIGKALLIVDFLVTFSACLVFDVQTGLFSFCGLLAKTFVIDSAIESINQCKYFNVICDNPDPICDFICNKLHRSATIYEAKGAFSHQHKTIILTALKRRQAIMLRSYIRVVEPHAFILITNTSEIIGKGFQGFG